MTCIVAVTDGQQVTMGGDSAGSNGWSMQVRSDTKVFILGPYVLGFTSSFRMGQLLRYSLTIGAPDTWDVDRFMATTFIDAVRVTLKDGGFATTKDGAEVGGTFLVGVAGRLYEIDSDYQVGYTQYPFAAVGSGYMAALGALHAMTAVTDLAPAERVVRALGAAADLTATVRGPYSVVQGEPGPDHDINPPLR